MIHNCIGRALGLSEHAEEDHLHFEMKTSDGIWNLWDCGTRRLGEIRPIVLSLIKEFHTKIYLYVRMESAPPRRFPDDEIDKALAELDSKPMTKPQLPNSKLAEATARLDELTARRAKK